MTFGSNQGWTTMDELDSALISALQDFVLDSLTKCKEVADVRTAVVFEHVRNHVGVPAVRGD
jgi:hypothetical protein